MTTSIMWFRRDLRLGDHPALLTALAAGHPVLPLFVWDPALVSSGSRRLPRLRASLAALDEDLGGRLVQVVGDPAARVAQLAEAVGARQVHVTGETTPYGRRRDARVAERLAASGRTLVETSSCYAVAPGAVSNRAGRPYQVFTPYSRAWRAHGWDEPAEHPGPVRWSAGHPGDRPPPGPAAGPAGAGESAALDRWRSFLDHDLEAYAKTRDRPDLDATSRLSVHLKFGEIHPRTMLADLAAHPAGTTEGAERLVTELAWREFYADVLWHSPGSARQDLRDSLADMAYDTGTAAERRTEAWKAGRTGFPFVDAGMRQLLAEGWMHNRVRMITASFLVKDLHIWWPIGARHFMDHLLDGDVASNSHGWQWVAGTGTDASPWFRIFNPVDQGLRFDPDGDYVRRWVPELAHLAGAAAHRPWDRPDGYDHGYPHTIVDHALERREALARYELARAERI